uniref:Uncharacterized protein n=1 Tax=Globodera rostochiensis TaxID=31243 RepID=A0A914GZ60_GLORO
MLRKNVLFTSLLALISGALFWTIHIALKKDQQRLSLQPMLVFYNRIPKTGSTTFANAIAYDLHSVNGFHARLVKNLLNWQQMQPLFIHGHIAFIDFNRFGYPAPVWINLLREPFERFLSHYYFLRYGDDFRVGLRRSKAGNNETFDECFQRGSRECDPTSIWLQIPYFCGTAHFCTVPGNEQAFQSAKRNLVERYLLVGLTERMEETVLLLEQLLPAFFRGAADHFRSLSEQRKQLRHTNRKFQPSAETEHKFKEHPVYRMEREFYEFGKAEFESAWRGSVDGKGGRHFMSGQFHFDKIKP